MVEMDHKTLKVFYSALLMNFRDLRDGTKCSPSFDPSSARIIPTFLV